jgi:hypothetical protein
VSARPLPERPNLDQLKHQAKDRLAAWKAANDSGATGAPEHPRLRDAQRAIAQEYGFASWDALRAHVEQLQGANAPPRRRGLDYEDPIPDTVSLSGPLTPDVIRDLDGRRVSGVKVDESVPIETLPLLATLPSLRRLDLSHRHDLVDADLAFVAALPALTAISLARCSRIGDGAVAHLRPHRGLAQVNLQWTRTGDEAITVLAGMHALSRLIVGGLLTDAGAARLRDLPALVEPFDADSFLSISSARSLTDEALAAIGTLAGVAALDVHMSVFGSPHYTAGGVAHLRGMTRLQELNFHGRLASDAVLREIAGISGLRHLHCQDIASGDDGFIALGACTTLEVLSARFCARITDRGFGAIARLPRLRSLGLGGPRLSDDAMAPLAEAQALRDLGPTLSRDPAFAHIARIPRLEHLGNMYNRSTTDAATRYLRGHPHLREYSALGTQITDESLRLLAGMPQLERAEFENCAGITDEGLRVLAAAPRLRKLSAWSCMRVTGAWTTAVRPGLTAKSEDGPPGHADGYRFETLVGHADVPIPPDAIRPAADAPGLLSTLACSGGVAERTADGVRLSAAGVDTRWMGLVTRDAFATPNRIELVVSPLSELRFFYAAYNHVFVVDDQGFVENDAPWFLMLESEQGERHEAAADETPLAAGTWARVTIETEAHERRLFVNFRLRHTWRRDYAGLRGRIGIGLRRESITVRELRVDAL